MTQSPKSAQTAIGLCEWARVQTPLFSTLLLALLYYYQKLYIKVNKSMTIKCEVLRPCKLKLENIFLWSREINVAHVSLIISSRMHEYNRVWGPTSSNTDSNFIIPSSTFIDDILLSVSGFSFSLLFI